MLFGGLDQHFFPGVSYALAECGVWLAALRAKPFVVFGVLLPSLPDASCHLGRKRFAKIVPAPAVLFILGMDRTTPERCSPVPLIFFLFLRPVTMGSIHQLFAMRGSIHDAIPSLVNVFKEPPEKSRLIPYGRTRRVYSIPGSIKNNDESGIAADPAISALRRHYDDLVIVPALRRHFKNKAYFARLLIRSRLGTDEVKSQTRAVAFAAGKFQEPPPFQDPTKHKPHTERRIIDQDPPTFIVKLLSAYSIYPILRRLTMLGNFAII